MTGKFNFRLIAKEIDDFERPFQLKRIKTVRAVLYRSVSASCQHGMQSITTPFKNYGFAVMRFCSIFGAVWREFFLSCCIAVVQNQAVCGIQKFSANFNAVCSFLMLFCAVFIRISVRFCRIRTPLTPPASTCLSVLLYGCKTCLPNFKSFQNHIRCPKEAATDCPGEPQCTEIFVDPASRLATHDQM